MLFWLGTHQTHWTAKTLAPLFLSARRLIGRKSFIHTICPVAIDSGGFSELSMFGEWRTSPQQYVDLLRRYRDAKCCLAWSAVQDWMCEPFILQKTGKTVREHQERTIESWHTLTTLAPDLRFVPVLQGWQPDDYFRHVELYAASGVSLKELALVGIGSVCRRQHTRMAEEVIRDLARDGIRLHGFGFKLGGLVRAARWLMSADSMAWSFTARRSQPLEGCIGHKNCANCLKYALLWRQRVLREVEVGLKRKLESTLF